MLSWFKPAKRVLEPHERISEVLFGLIMVLTFTGSLSVAEAGREDVRTMLIGALGCNIAWGLIDGVLYMMSSLAEKGRALATLRAVRKPGEPTKAHKLIAGALPPLVASIMKPEELESIRERLSQLPEPTSTARVGKSDWLGGLAVFLLVFLTTFPVAVPFHFHSKRADGDASVECCRGRDAVHCRHVLWAVCGPFRQRFWVWYDRAGIGPCRPDDSARGLSRA